MTNVKSTPGLIEWCEATDGNKCCQILQDLKKKLLLCKESLSMYLLSRRQVRYMLIAIVLVLTFKIFILGFSKIFLHF